MTFLFDIGRVLLDFDFVSSLSRLFPAGTPDPEARLVRLLDRKDEFEAGKIEVDAYIDWALGVLACDATPAEFIRSWQRIFTVNELMWRCVRDLVDQGHRLILFSNTNGIHCPWIFEYYPEFSLFEGAVLSFETGHIKPQPEIYHHAIEKYQLDPATTFYIDDLPENIQTGREIGFVCWQYDLKEHAAFEAWLTARLESAP
jgi:FMN phosphatase YigB (HAD superfamily)